MSEALSATTCCVHGERPAAARCPSCRRFFCPECITEHEGRLTCASCLDSAAPPEGEKKPGIGLFAAPVLQFVIALLVCWLIFHFVAQFLGDISDEFHDGTVWE